jgi:hypothetical protein
LKIIELLEQALKIDKATGLSDWHYIAELENKTGLSLRGNGSAQLQNDRGLGRVYVLEKQYSTTGVRVLESVRTVGYAAHHQTHRAANVPEAVKKWLAGSPCSFCGTRSQIEADHRDGRKQPIANPLVDDFQALCKHCNGLKREACKACSKTELRFDARTLGYPISYTVGKATFEPRTPRCIGCLWHDPIGFRNQLKSK